MGLSIADYEVVPSPVVHCWARVELHRGGIEDRSSTSHNALLCCHTQQAGACFEQVGTCKCGLNHVQAYRNRRPSVRLSSFVKCCSTEITFVFLQTRWLSLGKLILSCTFTAQHNSPL